eukprot:gnl/Trimastix_PCT/2679.p1 GENE.gnl/Trimastix_PCT/2679~~gnl/Trimastix_PCT/2679.p1  ORF type:complete len:895 (+),score=154.66 gnl/Trimastix_PCT/2679:447-3131(+)
MVVGAPDKNDGVGAVFVFERQSAVASFKEKMMTKPISTKQMHTGIAVATADIGETPYFAMLNGHCEVEFYHKEPDWLGYPGKWVRVKTVVLYSDYYQDGDHITSGSLIWQGIHLIVGCTWKKQNQTVEFYANPDYSDPPTFLKSHRMVMWKDKGPGPSIALRPPWAAVGEPPQNRVHLLRYAEHGVMHEPSFAPHSTLHAPRNCTPDDPPSLWSPAPPTPTHPSHGLTAHGFGRSVALEDDFLAVTTDQGHDVYVFQNRCRLVPEPRPEPHLNGTGTRGGTRDRSHDNGNGTTVLQCAWACSDSIAFDSRAALHAPGRQVSVVGERLFVSGLLSGHDNHARMLRPSRLPFAPHKTTARWPPRDIKLASHNTTSWDISFPVTVRNERNDSVLCCARHLDLLRAYVLQATHSDVLRGNAEDAHNPIEARLDCHRRKFRAHFDHLPLGHYIIHVELNHTAIYQSGHIMTIQTPPIWPMSRTYIIVITSAVAVLALVGMLICGLLLLSKRRRKQGREQGNPVGENAGLLSINYTYQENPVTDLEMIREIGRGSCGDVWEGEWQGTVPVAVKRVLSGDTTTPHHASQAISKELDLLKKVHHPNIVQLYALRVVSPYTYFVMELCHGSLEHLLHSQVGLSLATRHTFALEAASGMAYLHTMGALHRDLKSGNLLVTRDGHIKVTDFGSARFIRELVNASISMTFCGTPAWTAPEVLMGKRYTAAVDVYSFGIVLWELLTRQLPYADQQAEMGPMTVCIQVCHAGLRPPIPEICTRGDPNLQLWADLMTKCWDAEPSRRPTFKVIVQTLQRMIFHDGGNEELLHYLKQSERSPRTTLLGGRPHAHAHNAQGSTSSPRTRTQQAQAASLRTQQAQQLRPEEPPSPGRVSEPALSPLVDREHQ